MPGRERLKVQARSLLCFWAVHELGMNMTELSKKLNISVSAVSVSVKLGEKIVNESPFEG
jgi:REP-associated tyrosine transposase